MAKKRNKKPPEERREEALRPSRFLGYDRDSLGVYLMGCEAYGLAESQFRRAIWLNPFEARFKAHLAWSLFKQGRHADARACVAEIPEAEMDPEMRNIARLVEQAVSSQRVEDQG